MSEFVISRQKKVRECDICAATIHAMKPALAIMGKGRSRSAARLVVKILACGDGCAAKWSRQIAEEYRSLQKNKLPGSLTYL